MGEIMGEAEIPFVFGSEFTDRVAGSDPDRRPYTPMSLWMAG